MSYYFQIGIKRGVPMSLFMVKLVEKQYGQKKITPIMHLCLHICECALDYGPLYSFWCYSFKLMKYLEFLLMSKNVTEKAETGSELFPGTFMKPMKKM